MKGRLYISHFLTSWTDRVFDFACFLLIADIFDTSLLLASIYGFATTSSAILFGSLIGRWADSTSRLPFVRATMLIQKGSIVISCTLFYLIFKYHTTYLYPGIVFCGCLLKLAFIANNIAIEKDWVMVITQGDTQAMLTVMKRIDLFCKTMAPVMIGSLMTFGPAMGVVIIAVWNVVSLLVEYQLVFQTFKAYPELASKNKNYVANQQSNDDENTPLIDDSATVGITEEQHVTLLQFIRHKIFPASLAISLLYLTVLSFGGIMVSYLKMMGYSDSSLGLLRAVAGVAGMASTYILPHLANKIGIIRSGIWALWFESATLVPVVISLTPAYSGTILGSFMLFGGMSISRVGLWVFDIAETILLQQMVDPAQLGSISGWQHSLCNVFDLSQYIMVAIISDPKDFIVPATVSLLAVVCASISFTYFVKRERGHLFHLKKRS